MSFRELLILMKSSYRSHFIRHKRLRRTVGTQRPLAFLNSYYAGMDGLHLWGTGNSSAEKTSLPMASETPEGLSWGRWMEKGGLKNVAQHHNVAGRLVAAAFRLNGYANRVECAGSHVLGDLQNCLALLVHSEQTCAHRGIASDQPKLVDVP